MKLYECTYEVTVYIVAGAKPSRSDIARYAGEESWSADTRAAEVKSLAKLDSDSAGSIPWGAAPGDDRTIAERAAELWPETNK